MTPFLKLSRLRPLNKTQADRFWEVLGWAVVVGGLLALTISLFT